MKAVAALIALLLLCGSSIYSAPPPQAQRRAASVSIYDGYKTPAAILRGIARAESDETDSAIGDDGISIGRMQLNERFHALRAAAWGEYDPRNPFDAIRIADHILQDDYGYFHSWPLAVAAYRQGIAGVLRDGATMWYVERVRAKGALGL